MKYFFIALVMAWPASAWCQTSELAFNLGLSTSSKVDYAVPAYAGYQSRGGFSPYPSLKYLQNLGHWQFGIGLDFMMPHNSYKDPATGMEMKAYIAKPLLPLYLIANRKLYLGKYNVLYAGASLGIGIAPLNASYDSATAATMIPTNTIMPLIGVQAGYTHYFGRLGVNVEISEKWLPALSSAAYSYNINSATVGVRYRFK